MDYKEKYKQALEAVKELMDANPSDDGVKAWVSDNFPELMESEGEKVRKELIAIFKGEIPYTSEEDSKRYIAWLEKQGEQKPAEWSEEDETKMDNLCHFLLEYGNQYYGHVILPDVISWLKFLKDRVIPQSKQEWSEEDSVRLQRITDFLWRNRKGDTDEIYQQEQDVNWLKSLKPQKRWKPNNVHIHWLKLAINRMSDAEKENEAETVLEDLLEQLKKLKE